jgi:hypothetical protein
MCSQNGNGGVPLINRFTLTEKVLLRGGFYVFMIIGAVGIYMKSMMWGMIYTGFAIFGLLLGVLYSLCSHCPYPYVHSDCLFLPHKLIKKFFKYRPTPMSLSDKTGFMLIMIGLVAIPQYWLVSNVTLLILFWIACLPVLIIFPFHYCRRCRHFGCPFNSVNGATRKKNALPGNDICEKIKGEGGGLGKPS